MLSLNTLLFRLVAVVVLPPLGALADAWGLNLLLQLLSAAIMMLALAAWAVFALIHKRSY